MELVIVWKILVSQMYLVFLGKLGKNLRCIQELPDRSENNRELSLSLKGLQMIALASALAMGNRLVLLAWLGTGFLMQPGLNWATEESHTQYLLCLQDQIAREGCILFWFLLQPILNWAEDEASPARIFCGARIYMLCVAQYLLEFAGEKWA